MKSPKLSPRHCERSEAIHLATCACGDMDCFVASLLAMTVVIQNAFKEQE